MRYSKTKRSQGSDMPFNHTFRINCQALVQHLPIVKTKIWEKRCKAKFNLKMSCILKEKVWCSAKNQKISTNIKRNPKSFRSNKKALAVTIKWVNCPVSYAKITPKVAKVTAVGKVLITIVLDKIGSLVGFNLLSLELKNQATSKSSVIKASWTTSTLKITRTLTNPKKRVSPC